MVEEKFVLIAFLIGFYLLDCLVFLRPTEAIGTIALPWGFAFWHRRGAARRPGTLILMNFGMTFYPMRGYFPALLNPFLPAISAFKTAPLLGSPANYGPGLPLHRLIAARLIVRPLAPLVAIHALFLFAAIPLDLLRGRIEPLLITLGFDILIAGAIIGFCHPLIRILKLRPFAFWSLAVQSMICLPLSVNFPRKLGLLARSQADAEGLMPRLPASIRATIAQDFITALDYAQAGRLDPAEAIRATRLANRLRAENNLE